MTRIRNTVSNNGKVIIFYLRTSAPSSDDSARQQAMRAINTAAASWVRRKSYLNKPLEKFLPPLYQQSYPHWRAWKEGKPNIRCSLRWSSLYHYILKVDENSSKKIEYKIFSHVEPWIVRYSRVSSDQRAQLPRLIIRVACYGTKARMRAELKSDNMRKRGGKAQMPLNLSFESDQSWRQYGVTLACWQSSDATDALTTRIDLIRKLYKPQTWSRRL